MTAPIRFCLINTNAVSNTASSEVIVDNKGKGNGSKGATWWITPELTTIQPAQSKHCSTTHEIVPTKPQSCSSKLRYRIEAEGLYF